MKTDIKYASDVEQGDSAIVHDAVSEGYRLKSENIRGRSIYSGPDTLPLLVGGYQTVEPLTIPRHAGRLGRVRDASFERRITGLDELTDVHLVLTRADSGLFYAKFEPRNLVLVDGEREIVDYFESNIKHFSEMYRDDAERTAEKLMVSALRDYRILQEADVTQDMEFEEEKIPGYRTEEEARSIAREHNYRSEADKIERRLFDEELKRRRASNSQGKRYYPYVPEGWMNPPNKGPRFGSIVH